MPTFWVGDKKPQQKITQVQKFKSPLATQQTQA
jgi:hypothetical protein